MSIRELKEMEQAARRIHAKGPRHVVVKGGHLDGPPVDVCFDGRQFQYLEGERIETKSLHGTGCTFASAITAELAKGTEVTEAVRRAKAYITAAIRLAEPIGHGFGPTHHFALLYQQAARDDVIVQLEQAVAQLQEGEIAGLVPEAGSNLGLALPRAATLLDVAAWEGRIMRVGEHIHAVGGPRFGASRQVGTIILGTMHVDPRYRSAMDIRDGEDVFQACQAVNLRIAQLPQQDASAGGKGHQDSNPASGVAETIQGLGTVPDIIYDLGMAGKAAMMWVLGHDAIEVADKVLRIRYRLPTH
jgi:hydroxymethylpyrimidine/phosphomethylpyrimidine kinase